MMVIAVLAPVVGDLLKTNAHLVVECCRPGCARPKRRLSAIEAAELMTPAAPIDGLARRLRCSSCGALGREGYITARPCTLDQAAWRAREQAADAIARGEELGWDLDRQLATLKRLVGGGELGGDGPVQWLVERSSGGV